ncbi:hypothetical protein [Nonomuraea sediminis]|uniref:hypothetical protein n=1 Tax=Nonomuraea sediminis TaxID=2835864 RepID=UPI001BDCC824|nr:hypothetical protein [Nonomuraea sediminis]
MSGLALLGVESLPGVEGIDRHIAELDRAAAHHRSLAESGRGAQVLAAGNSGPASDALDAHLAEANVADHLATRFSKTADILRLTRGVLVWAEGILVGLGALAVAVMVHPELLVRLRAMAAKLVHRLREITARIGAIMRGMSKTLTKRRVNRVAARFHDEWRAGRRLPDGTYDPRMKTTTDQAWIRKHGTDQVDIANTRYRHLPADWQLENKESARIGVQLVDEARAYGVDVHGPEFMERASSVVHDKWLVRNGEWASPEQRLPYELLSEAEKQKDRDVIRMVLKLWW